MRTLVFFADIPFFESPFLEAEFAHLCTRFDRVVLAPDGTRGLRRQLAGNVEVETGQVGRIAVRSRGELLAALRSPAVLRELIDAPAAFLSPARLRVLLSFVARARQTARFTVELIAARRLDPRRTVFTTFWLDQASLGLVLARRQVPGLRASSRAHGYEVYEERQTPPYLPCRGALLRGLDRLFFISEDGQARAARWPGFDPRRHRVARLGVADPGKLAVASADGALRVVSCSHLVPVKRLDLMLRGLSALAERCPERQVHWRHFGDGPLRGQLESLARELRRPNLTVELPGHVANRELFAIYDSQPVDLFLNTSASEGIPVSVMEALSFGIPVLATDVGGSREAVRPPGGVLLPATPAPEQIAGAALDLARRGASRELREATRAGWRERFHDATNQASFATQLLELLPD
jgi:glycosyltransferase involved in cell wall biosynthesis